MPFKYECEYLLPKAQTLELKKSCYLLLNLSLPLECHLIIEKPLRNYVQKS